MAWKGIPKKKVRKIAVKSDKVAFKRAAEKTILMTEQMLAGIKRKIKIMEDELRRQGKEKSPELAQLEMQKSFVEKVVKRVKEKKMPFIELYEEELEEIAHRTIVRLSAMNAMDSIGLIDRKKRMQVLKLFITIAETERKENIYMRNKSNIIHRKMIEILGGPKYSVFLINAARASKKINRVFDKFIRNTKKKLLVLQMNKKK